MDWTLSGCRLFVRECHIERDGVLPLLLDPVHQAVGCFQGMRGA
jgi:hypothetical protein